MNRRTSTHLALLLVVPLLLPGRSVAACGGSAVCSDTSTSLAGQLGSESITISWSTDAEDSTVDYYVLRRYDCSTPSTCSDFVATIYTLGSCNTNEDYSYEDEPPTPLSSWTYTVEIWRTNGTRACTVDVVPE